MLILCDWARAVAPCTLWTNRLTPSVWSVDVDMPTAKLAVSGIVTFDEVPLLQLTLSLVSSLQRSKLTTQLELTYLAAQCWRMWLHACCFAVA